MIDIRTVTTPNSHFYCFGYFILKIQSTKNRNEMSVIEFESLIKF